MKVSDKICPMTVDSGWIQPKFSGEDWKSFESKRLESGTLAADVLGHIIQINPNIKSIHYFGYDCHVNSDEELLAVDIKELPVERVNIQNLKKISDEIHYFIPAELSETDKDVEMVLGISSRVELVTGEVAHIPMIDFMDQRFQAHFNYPKAAEALGLYPGYILRTDNSRHFWGTKLLSQEDWLSFLNYSRQTLAKAGQDVCEGFFDFSIKRGFSGLRIFAYPPYKKTEPYLEATV